MASGVVVTGELSADEDLTIDGGLDGTVMTPEHHLMIGPSASVKARLVARAVTVAGKVDGNIVASESVHVLPGASMRGHITAPSLSLADGAQFNGTVNPERSEAAMLVARYRQKHGEGA